ncbi:MAG: hypothetical protein FWG59_02260 [Betaproteobacteria bacterium]|nr:hypothetical protein [Betaproteobacteria bacterium]
MTLCKVFFVFFLALFSPLSVWGAGQQGVDDAGADEALSVLSAASLPADVVAAWKSGARFQGGNQSTATYRNGSLYGFSFIQTPSDPDKSVQIRWQEAQVKRAEARSINVLGLFAFNAFECAALQQHESLRPDQEQCKNIQMTNLWAGELGGHIYGVAKAPADAICSCRTFLDTPGTADNTSVYYAAIASEELARLYDAGEHQAVADFFLKNYKRRIFSKERLIQAASSFALLKKNEEAGHILNAVLERFADSLTSEDCEAMGDALYAMGEQGRAEAMFRQAVEKFNN